MLVGPVDSVFPPSFCSQQPLYFWFVMPVAILQTYSTRSAADVASGRHVQINRLILGKNTSTISSWHSEKACTDLCRNTDVKNNIKFSQRWELMTKVIKIMTARMLTLIYVWMCINTKKSCFLLEIERYCTMKYEQWTCVSVLFYSILFYWLLKLTK